MNSFICSARFPMRYLAMAVCVFVAATDGGQAAPVTLRFDATIDTVFPGIPFDSRIEFAVGDVVSGQFTFKTSSGDGETSLAIAQPFSIVMAINGVGLSSSDYVITVNNDAFVADFEGASIIDQLELVGAGLSATYGASDISIDPLQSTFGMDLWGTSDFTDVLDTAHIPPTVEVWNQFDTWRKLRVTLRNGEGGVAGFSATVDDFSQVPEPAGAYLLLSATTRVLILRRRMNSWTLYKKQEVCEWVGIRIGKRDEKVSGTNGT